MPEITIDQRTYEKLRFTATLMDRPVGDVVRALVERLDALQPTAGPSRTAPPAQDQAPTSSGQAGRPAPENSATEPAQPAWLPVFRVFKQQRFEGEFNPSTLEVRILSAPWSGKVFPSPTAAAQAVVAHVPGERETANTNGRKFWRLASTGKDLRSIIGQRF